MLYHALTRIFWLPLLVGAVVFFSGTSVAQEPASPQPPHQFFGSSANSSGALINGLPATDGSQIVVRDADGDVVLTTAIVDGFWLAEVDPRLVDDVSFALARLPPPTRHTVISGAQTAVPLSVDLPTHRFFGSEAEVTLINGEPVAHGTLIQAYNNHAEIVDETMSVDGDWEIWIDPGVLPEVRFTLSDVETSRLFAVVAGAATQVYLLPAAPPPPPPSVFGSESFGSGALIDGQPAPDGSIVTTHLLDGFQIAVTTISGGDWFVRSACIRQSTSYSG